MAGWASANKYSLLGAMRAAAQLLSYELPMVLAVASVAWPPGRCRCPASSRPGAVVAGLPAAGRIVFLVSGVAELQRPPFDMPVADSEIVFGAYTEYTGLRFAFFLLSEYAGIVVCRCCSRCCSSVAGTGPFSDQLGWLWTLLKGFCIAVSSSGCASPGRGCGRTSCSGSPGSSSSRSRWRSWP